MASTPDSQPGLPSESLAATASLRFRHTRYIWVLMCLLLVVTRVDPLSAEIVRAVIHSEASDVRDPGAKLGSKAGGWVQPQAGGELPYRVVRLAIPPGHRVADVEATILESHILTPDAHGLPLQMPQVRSLAEVTQVAAWFGYQLAFVRLNLLQPEAEGVAMVGELEVRLRTEAHAQPPLRRQRLNRSLATREAELVRSAVANPEQVDGFAPPPGKALRAGGPFLPAAYPDLEGSDVEYLIITSEELAAAFQVLADWKTRRGVPAVIRTIESIEAGTRHGADRQETLRNFLQDAYTKWSVQWVLLGGDTDLIPTRYLSSSFALAEPEPIPSDLYFAGLDGNWNADADALWGEAPLTELDPDPDQADLLAELNVSRAPVTSVPQVDVFVQKVIAYETPLDVSYQGTSLFLAEVLFPTDWNGTQSITMDGGQMSEDMIVTTFPPGASVQRLYENQPAYPGSLPLNHAQALAEINTGYNLVNHMGHGFRYNMSVGDLSIVNSEADALNNGSRLSIFNVLNCTSLAFDFSCLAEHYMNNPNGGAVAVVGASRSAYPLPSSEYQEDFYDLLFNQGVWRLGELFSRSRLNQTPLAANESAHRWSHYIYNMLGDPELNVYTTPPVALVVSHNTNVTPGSNSISVTVTDTLLAPVGAAKVCLQKDNDDYRVGWTDLNGQLTLDFTAESSGVIDVTVSGHNLQTYLGSIAVTEPAGAYVHLDGILVDDDAGGGSVGNGDGQLDAGETVDLVLILRNDGGAQVDSLVGQISVDDAYVSVLVDSLTALSIAPGSTSTSLAPVRLHIAANAPDGHVFELLVSSTSNGTNWEDRIRREVHAPDLELVGLDVIDTASGNGDGQPNEGETFEVVAWVKNYGSGRADGLSAQLHSTNPFTVQVIQGNASYASISPFQESSNTSSFELLTNFVDQTIVELRLTDSHGRLVVLPFELERPDATNMLLLDPTTSPTVVVATWTPVSSPDLAGYHLYRALAPAGPWMRITTDATPVSYFRDTGLQTSTRYYYYVTSLDMSGNESAQSPVASVSTNPPQLDGWPIDLLSETSSSPAIGDLDGDGVPEIVQGNLHVYAWHSDGVEIVDGDGDAQTWGVLQEQTGVTTAAVALAELDGSLGFEVISCNWQDNKIFVLDGDGQILWSRQPVNGGVAGYWATPAAADVDRDGSIEIFAMSKDGRLYAWRQDGTPVLAGNADGTFALVTAWTRSSPALGDLDGDLELEIVLTDVLGNLHAWNPDGSYVDGFPLAYGWAFYGSPVLGDVDDDGALEIVVVSLSGSNNLHVVRGNGSELAGFPRTVTMKSPAVSSTPALADLDADGKLEIIVGSDEAIAANSKLYVYRYDGTLYPGWPKSTFEKSESSPIVADFDGDGAPDIVFGGQAGVIRGWRSDGTELDGFPLSVGDFVRGTPAAGDVDLDGDLDLVFAGWDRSIYVWDLPAPWDPETACWPTFLHDVSRTGLHAAVVKDATDTADDAERALPTRLQLMQNQPNPFNPQTTISFAVPEGAAAVQADLRIHDVRGRLVRSLLEGPVPAGVHQVIWDGRDEQGRVLGSGVYFYRLSWGDTVRVRRMILMK